MMFYLAVAALTSVIFVNGWTDAPNAIASCVGSHSMKPGAAVALAAVFNLAGALTVAATGGRVAHSVSSIAGFGSGGEALSALFAGMSAVSVWSVSAWYFGIPTSESHALLAGIAGAAAPVSGAASFNAAEWGRVGVGLVLSTLPAYLLGRIIYAFEAAVCRKWSRRESMPFFIGAQRIGAAAGAYLHGLQDGQKFMGMIMLCISVRGGGADSGVPLPAVLLTAMVMAAGTAMGGFRIIKKVALDMARLDAPRGFAADLSSSVCLALCTAAGLPVSTTHAKTCAIMGAGSAMRRGGLNKRAARDLFLAWFLTFPACFILGFAAAELALLVA